MHNNSLIKASGLRKKLEVNFDIYLKREDLSPFGSHKGRSIPLMISHYFKKQGVKNFTISSSGNAALAAAIFVADFNQKNNEKIQLKIFIGKNIPWHKYHRLKKEVRRDQENISLAKNDRPKQTAFLLEKNEGYKNLRQSTDDYALIGYEDLAKEIDTDVKDAQAIFIPTSSGTTAVGLYRGFQKIGALAKIFFIQTDFCHPFIESQLNSKKSIASAIVDRIGHRRAEIKKITENHNGEGFVVTNKEIRNAIKIIKQTEQIKISPNSALAVAGLIKALSEKKSFSGGVVCLLTGE